MYAAGISARQTIDTAKTQQVWAEGENIIYSFWVARRPGSRLSYTTHVHHRHSLGIQERESGVLWLADTAGEPWEIRNLCRYVNKAPLKQRGGLDVNVPSVKIHSEGRREDYLKFTRLGDEKISSLLV